MRSERTIILPIDHDYPFTWLDELIEVKLNPLLAKEPASIGELPVQIMQVECSLKSQCFGITDVQQLETVVRQYATALQRSRHQGVGNLIAAPESGPLAEANPVAMEELNAFKLWLEARYPNALTCQFTSCHP